MDIQAFSSPKVEKALKFLLSPEVSSLNGNHTKASFLMSQGLSQEEVIEAFMQYYKNKNRLPGPAPLVLNNVGRPVQTIENSRVSGFTLFYQLCQKLIFLASVTSTLYYFYRQWFANKVKKTQSEKNTKMEEELAFIKTELQRISTELRQHQSDTNVLSELKSLKAILMSRQYFEEKQNEKLILPSWQLGTPTQKPCPKEESTVNGDLDPKEQTPVNGNSDSCTAESSAVVSDTLSVPEQNKNKVSETVSASKSKKSPKKPRINKVNGTVKEGELNGSA